MRRATATCLGTLLTLLLMGTYASAQGPAATSLSPRRGPTAGGTVVTILGSGFTGVTAVRFDGTPGTGLTIVNDNTLQVTTPAHAAGHVNVTIEAPDSTQTLLEAFAYGNVPLSLDDSFTTPFNTPLQVFTPGVLSNDNDGGGGEMTVAVVTDVQSGTLALSVDGGVLYTPAAGFSGTVTFTYRASNAAGPGNLAQVSILVGQPTGPQPPTGLRVETISGNTVTLRWTPSPFGAAPTGFLVEGGFAPGQVAGTLVTGSTAPVFTFTAPSGALYLRVLALSGADRSAPSNEILVFVNVPAAPSAPEGLIGLASGSTLVLTWRNTFTGGPPTSLVLDVTGAVTTSIPLGLVDRFTLNGVPSGTYTMTLRAVNASGSSMPSNSVTLMFPGGCTEAPRPATNVVAYLSGNTMTVEWDPPASGSAPTQYVLNVSGAFAGSFPTAGRRLTGVVGTGAYTFNVVSVNACGASDPTTSVTVFVP